MEPISGPLDPQHPITGNAPVSQAGDVNAIIRALADKKRRARYDLLGNRINNDNEQD